MLACGVLRNAASDVAVVDFICAIDENDGMASLTDFLSSEPISWQLLHQTFAMWFPEAISCAPAALAASRAAAIATI